MHKGTTRFPPGTYRSDSIIYSLRVTKSARLNELFSYPSSTILYRRINPIFLLDFLRVICKKGHPFVFTFTLYC